jgi:gamma-glutamyltranspeptidase/glutathione hydrolase
MFGLEPVEAAALAHVSQRNTGTVTLEPGIAPAIAEGLKAMGHATETADLASGVHTIRILPDGRLQGGADPRREGLGTGR